MSHTTTVSIEFKNREALAAAVATVGGTVLGEGTHRLFSGSGERGFGFQLKGWRYPCILRADDNTLAMDTYNGQWGDVKDLDKLRGAYTIEAGRAKCAELGWMSEIQTDGNLLIVHPEGGTMTLSTDGTVDCQGFIGQGCNVASAITDALGQVTLRQDKAELYMADALVRE